jgi:hypothetical protein
MIKHKGVNPDDSTACTFVANYSFTSFRDRFNGTKIEEMERSLRSNSLKIEWEQVPPRALDEASAPNHSKAAWLLSNSLHCLKKSSGGWKVRIS